MARGPLVVMTPLKNWYTFKGNNLDCFLFSSGKGLLYKERLCYMHLYQEDR